MRSLFFSLLVPFLAAANFAQSEVVIAEKGEKALPITIHPEAEKTVRFAAADLARILGAMTGTTPEIEESTEAKGIIIGTVAQFGVYKDEPGLAINATFDGREAFLIQPEEEEGRVWILGNREDGASHGVYTLLREHGYRALFPGENWEVIPKQSRVAVAKPSSGRPAVLTRLIWAGFGTFDKKQGEDVDIWRQRNRLGSSISGAVGHSWESMIRHNQPAFEANPNLYAENKDGTLNKNSLRHGTQAVVDFTLEHFKKKLEGPRQHDILSLAPTDGDNYTRDKETAARGDINESFYWYVNAVAKEAAKIAPDKLVATTAYYQHAKPPPFDLEPNVLVLGATMFGSGGLSLEDFFTEWSKRARYIGIRDYIYSGYQTHSDHPDGGYATATLERQARWLRNYPIRYYSAEGLWEWGVRGIGYYTLAQLLWDPQSEVSAILSDFCTTAYGPAAQTMEQFYKAIEPTGRAVRKFQLARAVKLLQKAATEADEDSLARINDMKLYLIHAALVDKARALPKNNPERAEIVASTLEWNYRNRRSYMLNYNCNRRLWMVNQTLLGKLLKRDRRAFWLATEEKPTSPEAQNAVIATLFGEDWGLNGGYIQPHGKTAELPPASAAEIEKMFDELVVPEYPEIEVEEISYSDRYVPVDTGLKATRQPDEALWGGSRIELHVWRPGPSSLSWEVTPNVRYTGKASPHPMRISVELPDGTQQEVARLEQNNKPQQVEIKLDQPGISKIDLHSMRRGYLVKGDDWQYTGIPTDNNTVLFLGHAGRKNAFSNLSFYFYVPKGTREIQIYSNHPARLVKQSQFRPVGGDNSEAIIDGELIRLNVAQGNDGRVWEVADGGVGTRFYFLNLPNILSLDPGKLLLPAEVAEKDRLQIVGP